MDQEDSFEKFDLLRSTAHDFVHAAEAYGRIIISELCLPDELKTIKPTALGGLSAKHISGVFCLIWTILGLLVVKSSLCRFASLTLCG
jgi:hypothetical protein